MELSSNSLVFFPIKLIHYGETWRPVFVGNWHVYYCFGGLLRENPLMKWR